MLLLATASISKLVFAFDGNNDNPCCFESGVSIYEVQCLRLRCAGLSREKANWKCFFVMIDTCLLESVT